MVYERPAPCGGGAARRAAAYQRRTTFQEGVSAADPARHVRRQGVEAVVLQFHPGPVPVGREGHLDLRPAALVEQVGPDEPVRRLPGDDPAEVHGSAVGCRAHGLRAGRAVGAAEPVHVADVDAAVTRVLELGGTVGEMPEARSGRGCACTDDQGTEISIWEPLPGYD
nr:hypothetical protein [Nonomuraea pusilla]